MGAQRVRMSHKAFLYPSELKRLRDLEEIDRQNLISKTNSDVYWEEIDRWNDPDDMGWLNVERGDTFNMCALEWIWRSEGSDRADALKIETERLALEVQERILELKTEMARPAVVWPGLRVLG